MSRLVLPAALCMALAPPTVPAVAAPALESGSASPAAWSAAPAVTAQWSQSGIEGSGATSVSLEMNEATDGTATGVWVTLGLESPPTSGVRRVTFPTEGRDGRRALRVVVRAGAQALASLPVGPALVDRTPPSLGRAATRHTPDRTLIEWAEEDLHSGLDAASGHYLEANTSPTGTPEGVWVALPWTPSGETVQRATVPAGALTPGTHLVRARTVDRAGNEASLVLGPAYNDSTPPVVSGVRVVESPTPSSRTAEIGYLVNDPQPGSGLATGVPTALTAHLGTAPLWEGLQNMAAEQRIRVYLPGPRTYRLVVRVTDRAGNVGVSAPVTVTSPASSPDAAARNPGPDGDGSPARRAVPRQGMRLRLTLVGGAGRRLGGRPVTVARIAYGQTVTLRGALTTPSGRPLHRAPVEVRDPSGRTLGRARTGVGGWFRITVVPETGGDLHVGVPQGDGRLALPLASARVVMRPRVSLRVSTRDAVAGGSPVVFVGRVRPAPQSLRGAPRKRVVLEWRDPLRREWRPVLNGYTRADGRYRFAWRFGVAGLAIPMRVSAPPELGWPFEPALSRVVTLMVR